MARHSELLDDNIETPNTTGTELQNVVQQNNEINSVQTMNRNKTTQVPITNKIRSQSQQTNNVNNSQNANNNQNVNNANVPMTTISIQRPSDYYDNTVQGYLNDYQYGVDTNNYQLQINSLTAIDKYRTDKGLKPLYTDNIYALINQRQQKINNQIKSYEDAMAYANANGDYDSVQSIGNELSAYKKSVNYTNKPNNSATYIQEMPEYRSQYDDVINGIVNELLTMRFTYNPSEDETFLRAQEYATNTAMEKMNARGILDSTMTAQIVASTVANLQTEYMKMAKEDFYKNVDRLKAMANFVIDLDDRQYSRWKEETSRSLEYYSALKTEASYQWNRVDALGYVDNEASLVLGVPVGTLSTSTRKSISDAQAKAESQYNEAMTSLMVAEAKEQLTRDTYAYKQALDVQAYANKQALETQTYANKKAIDSQYKTTTSNTTTPVNSKTDFTGGLKAETLIDAISGMNQEEAVLYARENANSRDTWVQTLNSIGLSEKEANNILVADSTEKTINYVNSLLEEGAITKDEWKNWYESNGLDWKAITYQKLDRQVGSHYKGEESIKLLADYIAGQTPEPYDEQIAEMLYNDIKTDYQLTDDQMMKLLEKAKGGV